MTRIAILDDWQGIAEASTDWQALRAKATLTFLHTAFPTQEALIAALRDGRLGAAGLDVFADEPNVPAELMAMDNVVLLPHVGSATRETRRAMGQLVLDNLDAHFAGGPLLTPV